MVTETVQYSALRCVSGIWQNNEKPLISNGLRIVVTYLLALALWVLFHCSRHSFGSLHVEMGTDMAVIQACLGHKNITTTQIYSKMAAQQMCEVVDKITLKRKEA